MIRRHKIFFSVDTGINIIYAVNQQICHLESNVHFQTNILFFNPTDYCNILNKNIQIPVLQATITKQNTKGLHSNALYTLTITVN